MNSKLKKMIDSFMKEKKGQGAIGNVIIGVVLVVSVVSLLFMFTTAVNVKTYDSVRSIINNPGNATIGADINATVESGFDSTATVASFMGVVFLALLAGVVIGVFTGFLSFGRGGGGTSF